MRRWIYLFAKKPLKKHLIKHANLSKVWFFRHIYIYLIKPLQRLLAFHLIDAWHADTLVCLPTIALKGRWFQNYTKNGHNCQQHWCYRGKLGCDWNTTDFLKWLNFILMLFLKCNILGIYLTLGHFTMLYSWSLFATWCHMCVINLDFAHLSRSIVLWIHCIHFICKLIRFSIWSVMRCIMLFSPKMCHVSAKIHNFV